MSDKNSHPIRNSIVASLVAAAIIALVSPVRAVAEKVLAALWTLVVSVLRWVGSSHAVPGWLILLSLPFIVFVFARVFRALREPEVPHLSYTQDYIRGAKWTWTWFGSRIINLAAFCPRCEMRLVYSEHPFDRTDFICENCNNNVVWSCQGGELSYAQGHIMREIERKVRTGDFPNAQPSPTQKRDSAPARVRLRKASAVAAGVIVLAYGAAYATQQARAENYCFGRSLPNLAGGNGDFKFVGARVSAWTLRAYCTHPGNGRSLSAMVVSVSSLEELDRLNEAARRDAEETMKDALRNAGSSRSDSLAPSR
jgi:hypothetical protein